MSDPPRREIISEADIETISDAEILVPPPSGPVARFVQEAWPMVNPVTAATGLWDMVRDLPGAARGILQAQGQLGTQAHEAAQRGDYATAARKGLHYLLPVVGPMIDPASEMLAQGNVAGAMGRVTGAGAALLGPKALMGLRPAQMPGAAGMAARAERGITPRVTNVMAPKVGPNKTRYGNVSTAIAPQVAREPGMLAFSRSGLATKVASKLEEAERALDAAADARNPRVVFPVRRVIAGLDSKIKRLTSETARAPGVRAGEDVVPSPNQARVAVLQQAREELVKLAGTDRPIAERPVPPSATYEALRRMRESYDKLAKAKYMPSATSDLMKSQGTASGAADVTGVLRDHMAIMSPDTAAANRVYHLWRSANDALQAVEEIERVRATAGRQMAARFTGALVGGVATGPTGGAVGALIGPSVDAALSSGATTQIATARLLAQMADALRSGRVQQAQGLAARLQRMTKATAPGLAVSTAQTRPLVPVPGLASEREPQ